MNSQRRGIPRHTLSRLFSCSRHGRGRDEPGERGRTPITAQLSHTGQEGLVPTRYFTITLRECRPSADIQYEIAASTVASDERKAGIMRMREQITVVIAVAFATTAVAVNVLALSHADDRRAENERVAVAAAWAQPIVPSTTNAPDTTAGTAEPSGTAEPVDHGVSTAPGQNKEDCIPPGQVDRDKPVPPGQDRDMCVPPGQAKDKDTPPGQDKDKDKDK